MKKLATILCLCFTFCLSTAIMACGGGDTSSSSSSSNPSTSSSASSSNSENLSTSSSTSSSNSESSSMSSSTSSSSSEYFSTGSSVSSSDSTEISSSTSSTEQSSSYSSAESNNSSNEYSASSESSSNESSSSTRPEITGITFEDDTVEYDTRNHALQIVGNVPQGSHIAYYYNDVFDSANAGVSEVGTYNVRVEISHSDYQTLTLTAKLKITTTEESLKSMVYGGKVYFQNNLDDNELYVYNGSTLTQVNSDETVAMATGAGEAYYIAKGLLSNSIKTISASTGKASSVYSVRAKDLVTDADGNLYYSVCGLLPDEEKDGIYKIAQADLGNGDDIVPVKLSADRTQSIVFANDRLWFVRKSDKALCSIATGLANQTATVAYSENNVNELIASGDTLYMNIGSLTAGKALYKFDTTNGTLVKLTTDNGQYLTLVGTTLYYVNHDLLTTTVFGDGIYATDASKTSDSSLPGRRILEANDNGYSSLASDGTYLYYYKLNDKHFYRATTDGEIEHPVRPGTLYRMIGVSTLSATAAK